MNKKNVLVSFGVVAALVIGYKMGRGGIRFERAERPAAASKEPVLVFGDFETAGEIGQWQAKGVLVAQSEEHAVHGAHAVKLTFRNTAESPYFKLERWFWKQRAAQNWSVYKSLAFSFYNPQDGPVSLILQIKDKEGARYKEKLHIGPHRKLDWKVPLDELTDQLNLKRIIQVNLFQWKPRNPSVVYLDYVRLEGEGAQTAESEMVSEGAAASPLGEAAITPNTLGELQFARQIQRWQVPDPASGANVVRVPLTLVGPWLRAPDGFPLSGGVPFAMGQLRTDQTVRLRDDEGAVWPAQTRPMATWEDGSIKWLLVTTQTPLHAQGQQLWLEYGEPVKATSTVTSRVSVEETPAQVTMTTGPLRVVVNKQRFTLFDSVSVDRNADGVFSDDERLAGGGDLVITHRNAEFRSSHDAQTYQLQVEEAGPLRATIKASGWFRDQRGNGFCRFTVRLQVFAGLSQIRVYHTFIYTGYPANLYHHEYEGAKLPENETIQDISLELPTNVASDAVVVTADDQKLLSTPLDAVMTITQAGPNAYEIRKDETSVHKGVRNEGWVVVQNAHGGIQAAVRDAWQQYPKALVIDPRAQRLVVKLWPDSAGELNLETGPEAYGPDDVARGSAFGLGKTHELVFGFFPQQLEPEVARRLISPWLEPSVLAAHPAWMQATDVLGTVGPPQLERFSQAELMLDQLFGWAERHPKSFEWYGMLDYGDTRLWYRKEAYDKSYDDWGWHPEGRWGWFNCEAVGSPTGYLMSFLRTHNLKYFTFGEAAARHIMDVDTVHHNTVANDPRLKGTISDEFSKVGSMHRHSAYHWSGRNEEATHTNVTGLLLYYYLTGYDRGWDVANEVGSFFLLNPVTYTKHPDIAPARAIGNVLWGDVLLYQATRDPRYRKAAEPWVEVFLNGQQPDGTWLETYNPRERSWNGKIKNNYITFHILPALIAYHRLTGNPSVARAIIKGTDAMISREPYLQFFDALAYSYQLTGRGSYLDEAMRRINELVQKQRQTDDPMMNGMVFQKAIYERVPPVLYSVPFALGAMDAPDFPTAEMMRER